MKASISERLIKRLEPKAKPYEVRDTRCPGFLVRVQPSGIMTYYVEFARGRRYRIDAVNPERPMPEVARQVAVQKLAEALSGQDPNEAKRKARAKAKERTLKAFIEEVYAPWAETHIKSHKNTLTRLKANFRELENKKLSEITPGAVAKWRAGRIKQGRKVSTVNRDFDDLKSVLSKAVEWGEGLSENPIAKVKRLRVDDAAKVRFLSDEEDRALRQALDDREERIRRERDSANAWRRERGYDLLPDLREVVFADYLKPMVLLSLHTGMRRGEVFSLTWANIDLDLKLLTVSGETAKSSHTRHIPLNRIAQETLADWRDQAPDPEGLVFPGASGERFNNTRRSWTGVLKAAKITGFRWHDLRHTFASRLVMAGVDLNTVRELLGHSSIAMTLRYAHLAPEHRAAAVAKLEAAA